MVAVVVVVVQVFRPKKPIKMSDQKLFNRKLQLFSLRAALSKIYNSIFWVNKQVKSWIWYKNLTSNYLYIDRVRFHHNITINSTFSGQCSNVLFFAIIRLRLSWERIESHLYMTMNGVLDPSSFWPDKWLRYVWPRI